MEHDGDVIGPQRAAYERATAIPMLIIAAVFVVVYSIRVLEPGLDVTWNLGFSIVLVVSWFAFLVDYLVRLALSPHHRWAFVRDNLLDLLAVFLPVFRAFRLLRSLQQIRYFRSRTGAAVRTQVVAYAALFAVLYVYMISLAELQVERDAPGSTITTFGDAVWWACVTMATVGYGDTYPVTEAGRFFAVLLMIGGVAIVGTASALVVSYLNERIARPARREEAGRREEPGARGDGAPGGDAGAAARRDGADGGLHSNSLEK